MPLLVHGCILAAIVPAADSLSSSPLLGYGEQTSEVHFRTPLEDGYQEGAQSLPAIFQGFCATFPGKKKGSVLGSVGGLSLRGNSMEDVYNADLRSSTEALYNYLEPGAFGSTTYGT